MTGEPVGNVAGWKNQSQVFENLDHLENLDHICENVNCAKPTDFMSILFKPESGMMFLPAMGVVTGRLKHFTGGFGSPKQVHRMVKILTKMVKILTTTAITSMRASSSGVSQHGPAPDQSETE